MRTGLLKEFIEIYSVKEVVNSYGQVEGQKELLLACPAFPKHLKTDITGGTSKKVVNEVEFTIRYVHTFKLPDTRCYISWNNKEWDIVNTVGDWYSKNKFLKLIARLN